MNPFASRARWDGTNLPGVLGLAVAVAPQLGLSTILATGLLPSAIAV